MKLTKRFAMISAMAAAAILLSAGGAQAQGDGGLLSVLGNTPLLKLSHLVPQTKQAKGGTSTDGGATNNNNNNNNNNNGNGAATNNNNNNNNVSAQAPGGLLSLLDNLSLLNLQICPKGQEGTTNTFSGNQNINCNQH
ncbi:hypothetical protein ACGFX8_33255 [Streptomyces sp. NPDC048362]|uniref:hypothetical protein n=1 Tax=Streptomyces sp. NPDC048362 TaxID=3365539 RepID=UPI003715F2AA